jgi:hypothetical protein
MHGKAGRSFSAAFVLAGILNRFFEENLQHEILYYSDSLRVIPHSKDHDSRVTEGLGQS